MTLTQVRDACNITASDSSKDGWMLEAIDAATEVIEDIVGRVEPATVSHACDGGEVAVLLPDAALSVTGVTVDGVASTDWSADVSAGIVYRGTGASAGASPFPAGVGNVVVTYTTGRDAVPAAVSMAATELVRHWFQNGQQGSRPAFGGAATEPAAVLPYAVPRRVIELLDPHTAGRMPGTT